MTERYDSTALLSKVVVHNGTVYVAGLVADKSRGGSVHSQTQEILSLVDHFLAKGGSSKSKLLSATIWLQDIRTVDEMNRAWVAWLGDNPRPVRACIEARLQSDNTEVEVQVTATR